jgi:virginiamycin B lyase
MSRGARTAGTTAIIAIAFACLATGATAAPGPPVISATTISNVTTESVLLQASVNPGEKATSYRFEVGPSDCSSNACPTVSEGELSAGSSPVGVSFELKGMKPGTTQHFRVVAENIEGEKKGPDRAFTTYLRPQVFAACPNEAFRAGNPSPGLDYSAANLPDCRAYEQASPVDKDGGDATGFAPLVKAATDGSAVSFMSTAGMPGAEGAQDIPSFLASRNTGSWLTHGMLPPAINGENARVMGWAPDFSEVFTQATLRSTPTETALLMRPATGGLPTVVVDYEPGLSPDFAGTTDDGSLLFESPLQLTPQASEGSSNVYLWDRTSGQISLVGAMNDESAPQDGAVAGSFDWIHGTNSATLTKGGSASGYYTQQQNVISDDGAAAFFTESGSGQLYLRRNPGKGQSLLSGEECTEPAKACTVRVSKSHKTTGLEPGGTERGGPRPAAFQQASPDGSSLLFISSEELTNDANTGPEPTDLPPEPKIASSDLAGANIDADLLTARANGLALDGAHLYWLDSEAGAIGRSDLDGENPDPAFFTGLPAGVEDLAVDSEYLYWVDPKAGTVGRAKVDGTGTLDNDFITGATEPRGVAVDGTYVYWTNAGGDDAEDPRTIGRAKLDGTEVDQGFIELETFTGGAKIPERITVGEGHIYVAIEGNEIFRFTLAGVKEDKTILESELVKKQDIEVGGGFVYWSVEGTEGSPIESSISRADAELNFSSYERQFITGSSVERAQSIAVNGSHIYWANNPPLAVKAGNDLYLFEDDGDNGELSDLTPDNGTASGAEVRGVLGASDDLSDVYFAANGVLAAGASPGNCGGPPVLGSGSCNLYRWHEGAIEFIAELETGGNGTETDATNWMAALSPKDTFPDERQQKTARVSPDGQTLLFRSQRQQSAYPSEGIARFYRFRVGEGLSCVSCNPTLAPPAGTIGLGSISVSQTIPKSPASFTSNVLSEDGNRFFFETTDALVAADTNGAVNCLATRFGARCLDVYEWEAEGTGSCTAAHAIADGGCFYLLSTGKGNEPALLADASADGSSAFIFSRSKLVGQDQDELMDVYAVRSGGGLASQNPAPVPICESVEACHGPIPPVPSSESAGSANFAGPADPKPKRKAAKKRHHKGKKHHKSKKQKQRKANAKRGASR